MSHDQTTNLSEWVGSYRQLSDEIADLLNDLQNLHFDNKYAEARDRIRIFRETKREAFYITHYSLIGTDSFFEDIEEQVGEEASDMLQDLHKNYSNLSAEFRVVERTYATPRKTPISGAEVNTVYDIDSEVPIIEVNLFSGEMSALQTGDSPSEVIGTSRLFVEAVNATLDQVDDKNISIEDDELRNMTDEATRLEGIISDLVDSLDSRGTSTSESDTE